MNSLQALKEQTLQELLEAYVKIAKDRILQALANERAKRDGRDKKSGSEIISFRGDRSKNIIESNLERSLFLYNEYAFRKGYVDNDNVDNDNEHKKSPAEEAVNNYAIQKFFTKVETLERIGKTRTIEAILNAAHHVCEKDALAAEDFVKFALSPLSELHTYATLVSNVFHGPALPLPINLILNSIGNSSMRDGRINPNLSDYLYRSDSDEDALEQFTISTGIRDILQISQLGEKNLESFGIKKFDIALSLKGLIETQDYISLNWKNRSSESSLFSNLNHLTQQ